MLSNPCGDCFHDYMIYIYINLYMVQTNLYIYLIYVHIYVYITSIIYIYIYIYITYIHTYIQWNRNGLSTLCHSCGFACQQRVRVG